MLKQKIFHYLSLAVQLGVMLFLLNGAETRVGVAFMWLILPFALYPLIYKVLISSANVAYLDKLFLDLKYDPEDYFREEAVYTARCAALFPTLCLLAGLNADFLEGLACLGFTTLFLIVFVPLSHFKTKISYMFVVWSLASYAFFGLMRYVAFETKLLFL